MILSKFLNKTFKAAKQSALQIYDDDYSNLKNMMPEKDADNDNRSSGKKEKKTTASNKKRKGVVFERSSNTKPHKEKSKRELDQKLESIRKYAAQQTNSKITNKSFDRTDAAADAEPSITEKKEDSASNKTINHVYSRKDIHKQRPVKPQKGCEKKSSQQEFNTATLNNMDPSSENEQEPRYDKFVEELPNGVSPIKKTVEQNPEKQKTDDIHKRLDRLESLMHLALNTSETAYSEHPLFHKLLHKGVSQKLIRNWFESIYEQGIHPDKQSKLFHSKLLQHINELLQQSQAGIPEKIMLFAGRSGTGKTHLVMKLASLPHFWTDKKMALASFVPSNENPNTKYSILEPFCCDKGIDFFKIQSVSQAKTFTSQWEHYDHILIDTPSLEMEGTPLIEGINALKKNLGEEITIETHYLVNTAVNGTAFNDPLAHDIEADHIALTHIDQSMKWGKTVQLLANTDYKLRYISSGPSITGNLLPFDPQKFARKLLRA